MNTIFINYRRDDSAGHAGRIHERLTSLFGNSFVFMDLDDIQPGVDFVRAIEEQVAACEVMLVLIGKRWLDSRDSSGRRRLDNKQDFVRLEIAKALDRNVRVVPVLLSNASMPAETDLPDDIRRLANLQAIELSDERWDYDVSQLVRALGGVGGSTRGNRKLVISIVAAAALIAVAALLMLWFASPPTGVAGRWVSDVQYDFGSTHSEVFVLQVIAGDLGGTASFLGVNRGIVEGSIEDNRISFTTHSEELTGDDVRQTQHHYRGTIEDDELRLVMQTEGSSSIHAPIQLVARRVTAPPEIGPWSDAQATLTLNDGRVVEVRAETLSNCISAGHDLSLASGQSVEFEKLKSFDVLRADPFEAPNAKAKLQIVLLDGQTIQDSVPANCDLFAYNEAGRFTTYFQNLKRVEFRR